MSKLEEQMKFFEDMDPDKIAYFLKCQGMRGRPGEAECCVLAEFLKEANFHGVQVGERVVVANAETCHLPWNIQKFVENFDDGKYPELEVKWS